jgi:hypothetical protein
MYPQKSRFVIMRFKSPTYHDNKTLQRAILAEWKSGKACPGIFVTAEKLPEALLLEISAALRKLFNNTAA